MQVGHLFNPPVTSTCLMGTSMSLGGLLKLLTFRWLLMGSSISSTLISCWSIMVGVELLLVQGLDMFWWSIMAGVQMLLVVGVDML